MVNAASSPCGPPSFWIGTAPSTRISAMFPGRKTSAGCPAWPRRWPACAGRTTCSSVVTNQSGIARGYYDVATMQALHDWMNAELRTQGAHIDAFYHCPRTIRTSAGPAPAASLLPACCWRAADDWFIDLERSWMIGDKMSDIIAGRAAGCTPILLTTDIALPDEEPALLRAASLGEAADLILSNRHPAK